MVDLDMMLRVATALYATDASLGQRQLCTLLSHVLQRRGFSALDRRRMQELYDTLPQPGVFAALLMMMAHAKLGETSDARRLFDTQLAPTLTSLPRSEPIAPFPAASISAAWP